jgi:hypothetical protein
MIDVSQLQNELRLRHNYPYSWSKKQDDDWDEKTQFIYTCLDFLSLKKAISVHLYHLPNFKELAYYAMNRWYNFNSAKAIEHVFCTHPAVRAHQNNFHKEIDFYVHDIPFDHKTTIFPKGFGQTYEDTKKNPSPLIEWLYRNQSGEKRHHLKNRIFIVLYAAHGEHWKLKSELIDLQHMIDGYLRNFNPNQLFSLELNHQPVLSDVLFFEGD